MERLKTQDSVLSLQGLRDGIPYDIGLQLHHGVNERRNVIHSGCSWYTGLISYDFRGILHEHQAEQFR